MNRIVFAGSLLLAYFLMTSAYPQTDSLIEARNKLYEEYLQFKSGMKERTWLKLVNLNQKAEKVMETEDLLIRQLIGDMYEAERAFETEITELKKETDMLTREVEKLKDEVSHQTYLAKIWAVVSAAALVLFVLFLTLFILMQRKVFRLLAKNEQSEAAASQMKRETEGLREQLNAREEAVKTAETVFRTEKEALQGELEEARTGNRELKEKLRDLEEIRSDLKSRMRQLEEDLDRELSLREKAGHKIASMVEKLKQKLV